jgi:hypothetical protein
MPSRHRIHPIRKNLFLEDLTVPKKNKYAGLRKEADEYKAQLRAIGDERRRKEKAAAATAASKPRIRKRTSEPNLFTSTFRGLLNEWFTFQWHALKDWTKKIKQDIIPTICCLKAEAKLTYNE